MNCDYLYKTKYVQEYSDIELNLHSFLLLSDKNRTAIVKFIC